MPVRQHQSMWDQLIQLSHDSKTTLQHQLREELVSAILNGQIALDRSLPSSRELAKRLGIARNTVVITYQNLVDDGYLCTRERSGHFINAQILKGRVEPDQKKENNDPECSPDWWNRYKHIPSRQQNINKPSDWRRIKTCFLSTTGASVAASQ